MKIIDQMNQYRKKYMHKKQWIIVSAVAAVLCITIITLCVAIHIRNKESQSVVYKETTVVKGDLTVGITEDSTVSIGTVEQTFDLDISALVSDSSSSSTTGSDSGRPGSMGGGMMNFGSGNTYTSKQQEMDVESVAVTIGQKISVGDVLYTLTEDSVSKIRTQLEKDVADTKVSYDALLVEQKETQLQAEQGYDTYVSNGNLAQATYNVEVKELQDTLEEAEEDLNEKSDTINENLEKIADYKERLEKAEKSVKDAQAGIDDIYDERLEQIYYYVTFLNAKEDASDLVDELEKQIEELEEENETLVSELKTAGRTLTQAQRDYDQGVLTAKQTMDTDVYYKDVASEWYDIQLTSLNAKAASAQYEYEDAVEKLDRFNSSIVGNNLVSEYEGVITAVPLNVDDTISMNTSLISLYDQTDVTMEVTLSEEDKEAVEENEGVVIHFTAYPEAQYEAEITDIGDATYDSDSGEVYYTITVTLQGDVTGLYEGMDGDITFVTKESKEVIYVANRAIIREGTQSYVKVKDENGRITQKEVTTGFSDGTNVEIVEGLSVGDTVLIESKVSE